MQIKFNSIQALARFLGVPPEFFLGGLNLSEAAGVLGLSISAIRNRALSGKLGHRRDGRRFVFGWIDIARYIEERYEPAVAADDEAQAGIEPSCEQGESRSYSRQAKISGSILAEAKELGLI